MSCDSSHCLGEAELRHGRGGVSSQGGSLEGAGVGCYTLDSNQSLISLSYSSPAPIMSSNTHSSSSKRPASRASSTSPSSSDQLSEPTPAAGEARTTKNLDGKKPKLDPEVRTKFTASTFYNAGTTNQQVERWYRKFPAVSRESLHQHGLRGRVELIFISRHSAL